MGWKDAWNTPYTFAFLDYALNEPLSIDPDDTWTKTTLWNGNLYNDGHGHTFGGIDPRNIMVIAAIFNATWHQGYADPPSGHPFNAYYVDETTAAPVYPIPNQQVEFSQVAPSNGATNVPGSLTSLSVFMEDPDGDSFTWSIETSPDIGSSSGTNEHNGTKTCSVSNLDYSTTYTWYVNATDSGTGNTTSAVYTFTTEEYRGIMVVESTSGNAGEQGHIVYINGTWNITIGGYDIAMSYDASKIQVTKVDLVGTVVDYPDTEWQVYPVYGTGKVAAAAIAMDYNPPDDTLPPASGKLFRMFITIKGNATLGDTVLNLDQNIIIGSVPYYCSYAPPEGPVVFPTLFDGTLTITRCGDANNDGAIDVGDVVYLVNYLFRSGPAPLPLTCRGDCNGDSVVDVGDVVYLINYLFRSGPAPGRCCG